MKTILIAITLMLSMTGSAQTYVRSELGASANWSTYSSKWIYNEPVPLDVLIVVDSDGLSIPIIDATFRYISEISDDTEENAIFLAIDGDGISCHVILSKYIDELGFGYISIMYSSELFKYAYKN